MTSYADPKHKMSDEHKQKLKEYFQEEFEKWLHCEDGLFSQDFMVRILAKMGFELKEQEPK